MNIAAVLFDMDGVIISTRLEIEEFWHYWAGKAGIRLSEDDIENYVHGCPPERTLSVLFPTISDTLKHEMRQDSLRIGKDASNLVMPGLFSFMDYLDQASVPFGIVTSHTILTASKIVQQLGIQSRYRVLVTADQVKQGKPFPDPYLLAAERLDLAPDQILVFEDSVSGCTSAVQAGMNVLGVNTEKFAPSLRSLGVIDVIADFSRIGETIDRHGMALRPVN